jgi:hypothetical protein
MQATLNQPERSSRDFGNVLSLWRENVELLLAAITLVALLIGWIGGSLTGALPVWAVTLAALVAFAAGGYSRN